MLGLLEEHGVSGELCVPSLWHPIQDKIITSDSGEVIIASENLSNAMPTFHHGMKLIWDARKIGLKPNASDAQQLAGTASTTRFS